MKFVLLVFCFFYFCVESQKVQIWTRIPQFYVDDRVSNFLNKNKITNCFEFIESPNIYLLKCWRENQLINLKIEIFDNKNQYAYI
tara:strand:+ start:40 stop:294 length:255 start_codon:yes stop_codon:yes gene_type:complete